MRTVGLTVKLYPPPPAVCQAVRHGGGLQAATPVSSAPARRTRSKWRVVGCGQWLWCPLLQHSGPNLGGEWWAAGSGSGVLISKKRLGISFLSLRVLMGCSNYYVHTNICEPGLICTQCMSVKKVQECQSVNESNSLCHNRMLTHFKVLEW